MNTAPPTKSMGLMETMRAYIYAGGKLLAERTPDGNLYWLHTNHLGNSSRMTDQNGTMVYRGEFDPYGNLVYEWGLAGLNTRKFTGYERDSNTGLDYANARMYGPGRGRFMQPDPAGLKGANRNNPASLNRYSYVNNDPVNSIDPSGNFLANPWCQQIYIDNIYVGNTCGGGWGGFFDLPYPEYGPGDSLPEPESFGSGANKIGERVPLQGKKLATYNNEIARLLSLLNDPNSDCSRLLIKHLGHNAGSNFLRDAIRAQRAFDGELSTISLKDAGISPLDPNTGVNEFISITQADAIRVNAHEQGGICN
ncbi:MAG: RHS domain-containing protein [Acidobacteria bacterium]|nr:RHS domain-containing protein [Acidobacteriota bacterium]